MCHSLQCYFPFYTTLQSLLLAYPILNTTHLMTVLLLSFLTHNCTTQCFLPNPFNYPIITHISIHPILLTLSQPSLMKTLPLFISYVNKTYFSLHPFLPCSILPYMYYNPSHITLLHHNKPNSQFIYLYYSY